MTSVSDSVRRVGEISTIGIGKPGTFCELCLEAGRLTGKVILKRKQKGAALQVGQCLVAVTAGKREGKGILECTRSQIGTNTK